MSWLVTSLANSLKLDNDNDNDNENDNDNNNDVDPTSTTTNRPINSSDSSNSPPPSDQPRGVKDDLSEITKTFTRQLWGVAAFLAPPPPPPEVSASEVNDGEDPVRIAGIRNDLSEIGGKFKSEISKLSNNKAVSEFTKIATSLLHFGGDEDFTAQDYADRGVVGVTEEVVAFARDVAMHPETWLDFPLFEDDDDDDNEEFDLSDAQQEHAWAVERLAPELAALRTELCLGYMTEGSFWKIYFVLVHPRLSKHDAVILSTPPIMKARAMLTQESQIRRKPDSSTVNVSVDSSQISHNEQLSVPTVDRSDPVPVEILSANPDVAIDKHPISVENPVVEKEIVQEGPVKKTVIEKSTPTTSKSVISVDEEDEDEWLKEETETTSFKGTSYPLGNDDDDDDEVTFSDLEEEDDVPASNKNVGGTSSIPKESGKLKNKESNDWLDIEDIDDA